MELSPIKKIFSKNFRISVAVLNEYFPIFNFKTNPFLSPFSLLLQGPPQSGNQFKFNLNEHLDRIKEEFVVLQNQYQQ